jgi:hypothetical protein
MKAISKWATLLSAALLAAPLIGGCVATTATTEVNDPASPEAPTAPAPERARVLDQSDAPVAPSADTAAAHEHGEHEQAHEHDTPKASPAAVYTCPMHPEIQEKQMGRCPKCGMNLEPSTVEGK